MVYDFQDLPYCATNKITSFNDVGFSSLTCKVAVRLEGPLPCALSVPFFSGHFATKIDYRFTRYVVHVLIKREKDSH